MHKSIHNLTLINEEIKTTFGLNKKPNIIAVSKTFSQKDIEPLISYRHTQFYENKVQESISNWTEFKKNFKVIKLHMIGKLQTNKAKFVLPLFDYLHSLDNKKLAEKISSEQKKLQKKIKIFIQVNIGNEKQKNGIEISELENFYNACINTYELNIIGLMCIPPENKEAKNYFKKMIELNKFLGLKELSMGMSSDYLDALKYGSTYIRIGSKIFGSRH